MRKFSDLFQPHPDPNLRLTWNAAQLGVLLFSVLPLLGIINLVFALLVGCRQKFRELIRRPLNWGFAIFSLWLIINSFFAYQPAESFLGLAHFLPAFLFFAVFSELIQTPAQMRRLAWLMVIPGSIVVILGLGQLFLGWSEPSFLQAILAWTMTAYGNPLGRMSANFMYANILAIYLLIVFVLGLGLWVDEWQLKNNHHRRIFGNYTSARFSSFRLSFLSFTIFCSGIGIVLSSSRNAWAIALLGALALATYQGWHWLTTAVVGIAGSIFWAAFGPAPIRQWLRAVIPNYFWARINEQLYPDRIPASLRSSQWEFAWTMIQQRPWTGWGLRNFTPLYQAKTQFWLGHPHNLLLMFASETGIPATIFFYSLIGWIMAQAVLLMNQYSFDRERDKLIIFSYVITFTACILFNTLDISMFEVRANIPAWILISAMTGVVYHHRSGWAKSDRPFF